MPELKRASERILPRQGLALPEEWEGAGALGLPCEQGLSLPQLSPLPVVHTGPPSITSLGLSDGSADEGALPKFDYLSSYPRTCMAGGEKQFSPVVP